MSKYVLMHGTFIELSNDELMHWKYIKREKKNGRWVYYYDQSAYDNSIAVQDYKMKQKSLSAAKKQYMEDTVNYSTNKSNMDWKTRGKAADKAVDSTKKYYAASIAAKEATKRYKRAKVRTFAARTISKGVVKVANLLSGLGSKKKRR